MEKYFTIACAFLLSVILISATLGYFFAESRTREVYTCIQAETLSRMFQEDSIANMGLIGKKYVIEGKVKSVLCINGKYTTLVDCGEYPEIYVENCVKEKGKYVKINVKIKEFIGFLICIEVI